ncbi:phage tail protein [Ectopseudomonas mendocina]|nr:tape measure protein [Pseudomonas mendocina]TRO24827.1 phage tail protein [Pseudomonas mendocina]
MTDVELRLTADLDQATKEVAGFRKEYQDMVRAVEKPLRQVNIARDLERDLDATGKAVRSTKEQLRALQSELINTERPSERLKTQYRDMASELQRLERVEARQQNQLSKMRAELNGAGIDTSRLAAEQRRLNAELSAGLSAGRNDAAVSGIRARAAALAQVAREQRAANLEQARENLGVNRYRELQSQLGRVRAEYQLLRTSGKLTTQELAIAQRSMTERVRETQRALRAMNAEQRAASGISGLASGIGGAVGAVGAGFAAVSAISAVSRAADAYNLMNARLRLATTSQEEFNVAQRELSRIAQETEAPVQSLVTLYGRISRPLREAGRSQEEILRLTETVSNSFRISGATAQEAENGVIQFAQALGAGALRGEEFNSVAEQAPRLMQALADGIGVPVGALKEMAAQGQLTAGVVTDALNSQFEVVREAAQSLPATVSGALTKLGDVWRRGLGQADVQPLIDSINSLGKTLSDPVVVDNLVTLASALATLAGTVVDGASEFVDFGKRIAFIAANSQGLVTELDKVDQQIADLDRSLAGTGLSTTIDGLLYSKEELQAKRAALVAFRATIVEQQTGLNAEVDALAKEAAEAARVAQNKQVADYASYIANIDTLRKSQIKAAQDGAKALVSAEKKALSDLQKVRDERLAIEQRYEQAIADLSRGPKGDQNYLTALSLRQSAEQALANGDIAGAQKQAQAALKVIQELVEAGDLGMTVGIKDFIRSLGEIELEANSIAESNAADQLASIRDEMQQLADKAKQLEGMPVSVKTDDATIEQVRTTIESLVQQLSQKEVVIPVRVLMPDIAGGGKAEPSTSVPALATGGILRGPGTGTSDSILARLSNGEGVINARAVQYYGADLIHQLNNLRAPRFATGGVMGNVPVPSIPSLAPALQQQLAGSSGGGSNEDWGTMIMQSGEHSFPVRMPRSTAEEIRREVRKFASTGRPR